MNKLIDTHAHFTMEGFKDSKWWYEDDITTIKKRAENLGIVEMINVFCDPIDFKKAKSYNDHFAIGCHPNDAEKWNAASRKELLEALENDKVVAIGETGLDLHYDVDFKIQIKTFIEHLEIAQQFNLPVILHIRDAYCEFFDFVEQYQDIFEKNKFVLHCFAGNENHAELAKKHGFYIGVGGTVTFKNNKMLQEIVKNYPQKLILLETDCPFLAPVPYRGKINEPSYLVEINQFISELLDISNKKCAEITTANAKCFFNL